MLLLTLSVILLTVSNSSVQAICYHTLGAWKQGANCPNYHIEGGSIVVDNKFYVIGGFGGKEPKLDMHGLVDIFDASITAWKSGATLPQPMSHVGVATDGVRIWVAGGYIPTQPRKKDKATNQVWQYTIAEDSWQKLTPLPEPRSAGGLVLSPSGQLHFIAGLADRNNNRRTHWTLDVNDTQATWKDEQLVTTKAAKCHYRAVLIGNHVHSVGGQYHHDHNPQDLRDHHVFDLDSQSWSLRANLLSPRSHAEASIFVSNGRIITLGGRNNQDKSSSIIHNTVDEYDPKSDTWKRLGYMPYGMIGGNAGTVLIQGQPHVVFTTGGLEYNVLKSDTYLAPLLFNCTAVPAVTPPATPSSTTPPSSTPPSITPPSIPPVTSPVSPPAAPPSNATTNTSSRTDQNSLLTVTIPRILFLLVTALIL